MLFNEWEEGKFSMLSVAASLLHKRAPKTAQFLRQIASQDFDCTFHGRISAASLNGEKMKEAFKKRKSAS